MTYILKITDVNETASTAVDMTHMNPQFSYRFSNPVIVIPTPMSEEWATKSSDIWSTVTISLNMSQVSVTITFKEAGGLVGTGGFDINTPVTVFERLMHLSRKAEPKKLFVNNSTDEMAPVAIMAYTAVTNPGQKDIVEHSLTLQYTMKTW
jgi:hypothetical protein